MIGDLDSLREQIRALARREPDVRRETLTSSDSHFDSGAVRVLDALFEPERDGPLQANTLERRLRQNGYSHADVTTLLAAAAEAPDIQAGWAQSWDVERRDELILRLHTLADTSLLTDDLVPFLMHQLRSPDSSIYQEAAIAIGRHLDDNARLFDAVQEYAATRSLDLSTPTSLTGNRTRRRVFLVQVAARATDQADESRLPALLCSERPIDVDPEGATHPIPADQEDRAVLLLAYRLLLDAPDQDAATTTAAEHLLTLVSEEPIADVSPFLLQRWGELLDALVTRDVIAPTTAAETWGQLLESIVTALDATDPTQPFPETAHALFLFDEHARTLAAVPDSVGSAAAAQRTSLPEPLAALLASRVLFWRRWVDGRRPPDGWPQAVPELPETASPGLRDVLRARPPAAGNTTGAVSPVDADLACVEALLGVLAGESRWRAQSAGDRALSVVFLLSTIQNLAGEYDRVLALLRTREIPVPPGEEARSRALAAVLRRVFRFENEHLARFLDSRILDSISDLSVLLTLLPTDEPPLLTADLADDLEHQIRRNLRTGSKIRPLQLLVLTTVRDPHPSFYESLKEIVTGRTYTDDRGRVVPMDAAVDAIIRDAAGGRSVDDDPWSDPTLVGADPVVEARSQIRHRLAGVNADGRSLLESLETFLDALGVPEGPRDTPANDTLLGVIQLVHPANDRMLLDGAPSWRDEDPESFVDHHSETVASIRGRIDSLQPTRIEEAMEVYDGLERVREDLEEVVAELVPVLPDVEADRLSDVFDELQRRIDAYAQGLRAILRSWNPRDPPTSSERWNDLLDEVTERWEIPDRLPLLQATLQSLESASGSEGDVDSWAARRELLGWVTTAPDDRPWSQESRDAWERAAAELWSRLLDEAMDEGREGRVRDLLGTIAFDRLLAWPSSVETLECAHEWALDRYMIGVGRHIRVLRQGSSGTSTLREYLREGGAFFVHHSSMWIAIFVGAILLQDFGQGWQAMAQQGDIQGIAITFVLAIGGVFSFVMLTLHRKTAPSPREDRWAVLWSHVVRGTAFVGVCWAVALTVTTFLWWLLSGTDQVVHGPDAILNVIVWSSFALLAGIFLGFVAKDAGV